MVFLIKVVYEVFQFVYAFLPTIKIEKNIIAPRLRTVDQIGIMGKGLP